MIDKNLIHQAAEDIDIFQADLTEEYDRLTTTRQRRIPLWPLAAACVAGLAVIFLTPPKETKEEQQLSLERRIVEEWQYEDEQSMIDAQLAYQQEIKEKGERLACYIHEQQKALEEQY